MATIQKTKGFAATKKLLDHLKHYPGDTQITFFEDSDCGNLYALSLSSPSPTLARKVAGLCGCPADDLPTDGAFEASDYWKGEVSFRDVADELTAIWGEFFDETISLFGLRAQVGA